MKLFSCNRETFVVFLFMVNRDDEHDISNTLLNMLINTLSQTPYMSRSDLVKHRFKSLQCKIFVLPIGLNT